MSQTTNLSLIICTAPSGLGKTYIAKQLGLPMFKTYTTRPMRPEEEANPDYYHISESAFQEKIKQNFFLEHVITSKGDFYGSSKKDLFDISKYNNNHQAMIILDPAGRKALLDFYFSPEWKQMCAVHGLDIQVCSLVLNADKNYQQENFKNRLAANHGLQTEQWRYDTLAQYPKQIEKDNQDNPQFSEVTVTVDLKDKATAVNQVAQSLENFFTHTDYNLDQFGGLK